MKNINFQLLDEIKYLIRNGKTLNEVSHILNIDLNYIRYLCKKIKTDIIQSSNCEDFFLVPRIDKLLNKQYKSYTKFPYQHEYMIIDMINLPDEEIMKELGVNIHRYLSFLRAMYFMLYTYNIKDVDKCYLPIIKEKIDKLEKITDYHKYVYTINEFNGLSEIEYPKYKKKINVPHGKIFNFANNNIKFIVISDLHLGAVYENIEYLNKVYEYASKNGIRCIINTGDLIEGNCFNYDRCKNEYRSINSQLEHVFYDHCYDENIDNLILLGNHDFSSFIKEGIDIGNQLCIRDDFHILGYKEAYLKIRDDFITLKHEVSKILTSVENQTSILNFTGHSHQYRCMYNDDSIVIKVPCLCDISSGPVYVVNKGFIVCNLHFDSEGLCHIETEYIRFDQDKNIKFERTLRK